MFYSPSGQIQSDRGVQKRIPESLVDLKSGYTSATDVKFILALAGNGETIIKLDRSNGNLEEISWLENIVKKSLHPLMTPGNERQGLAYVRAVSQTGKFMVYEDLPKRKSAAFYLLDRKGMMEWLRMNPPCSHLGAMFFFSYDEQHLSLVYSARP